MLLGLPMHLVAGRVVELGAALPALGAELPERLAEAPGWAERFALLDAAIGRRLMAARVPSPDVARAWRRLRETNGRVPVARLAAELRCSRRHLSSRFREQIGVTPKAAARVMRFHHAMDRLHAHGGGRWAEIAAECGYYDQSHLHRDFRAYAGLTPGEVEARLLPHRPRRRRRLTPATSEGVRPLSPRPRKGSDPFSPRLARGQTP